MSDSEMYLHDEKRRDVVVSEESSMSSRRGVYAYQGGAVNNP